MFASGYCQQGFGHNSGISIWMMTTFPSNCWLRSSSVPLVCLVYFWLSQEDGGVAVPPVKSSYRLSSDLRSTSLSLLTVHVTAVWATLSLMFYCPDVQRRWGHYWSPVGTPYPYVYYKTDVTGYRMLQWSLFRREINVHVCFMFAERVELLKNDSERAK